MPLISDAFPSNYLKAADLQGRQVTVKIRDAQFEVIGQGQNQNNRLVIYFEGKDKGLVLNKTNANNIAMAYGDDTDDWIGAEIIMFEAMVDYQGRTVPAIRVKVPPRRPAGSPPAQRQQPAQQQRQPAMAGGDDGYNPGADLDDEIPF